MLKKTEINDFSVLNRASDYGSAFSRGIRVECNGFVMIFISGTASVDEHGKTAHLGDFRAQVRRTFANITALLASEGATWHDVVRTTCFLRDIDRDYAAFNEERTKFYDSLGLRPYPASTAVEARLCRPDLLYEMEAIAILKNQGQYTQTPILSANETNSARA